MHPRNEVRRAIGSRIHYALWTTTDRRWGAAVPAGFKHHVRPLRWQGEEWYQHWLLPDPADFGERQAPLHGLDLHFTMLQLIVDELDPSGEIEWYKSHEPAAVEQAYARLLASDNEGAAFLADFLDLFARGQFLGNANHRTAVAVLSAIGDWRHATGEGLPVVQDMAALQAWNSRSKAIIERLTEPHQPRGELLEQHRAVCLRLVEEVPWLQSMARAKDLAILFREALVALADRGV